MNERPDELADESSPKPASGPNGLQALALLPIVLTGAYLYTHYDQIPASFPIHWDIHGEPNGWTARSGPSVYGMLGIGAVIEMALLQMTASVSRSYKAVARLMPAYMAMVAWVLSLTFSAVAMLPVQDGPLPHEALLGILFASAPGILLATAWLAVKMGRLPAGDSTHWHAGFYYNPEDDAIWVPKRLGIGWTLNMAQPAAWVILIALLGIFGVALASALRHVL
jgi:uncharacterized membrane protein